MQKPSVGRIVHYYDREVNSAREDFGALRGPFAAIVTAVRDSEPVPASGIPYVDLWVVAPDFIAPNESTPFSEEPAPGHWSWPPRV